jgi:lipoprotein signal peptidase
MDMTAPKLESSVPRRIVVFLLFAVLLLAADQGSKAWARDALGPFEHGKVTSVIPGYFELRLSYNRGTAFSIVRDAGTARHLLSAIGLIALAAITIYVVRHKELGRVQAAAFGALAAGALGNVLDRMLFAKVTDFIVWRVGSHEWPAFNVADAALLCGVAALLIDQTLHPPPKDKPKSA